VSFLVLKKQKRRVLCREAPPSLEIFSLMKVPVCVWPKIAVTFSSRQQILRGNLFYYDSKQSFFSLGSLDRLGNSGSD